MNKQCHNPTVDGEYITLGSFVVCAACSLLVSKSELVGSMLAASYSEETRQGVIAILSGWEAEIEELRGLLSSILTAMKGSHDSDLSSLAEALQMFY